MSVPTTSGSTSVSTSTSTAHPFERTGCELARKAVNDGAPLPDGVLPPGVFRSWERARAAGVRPGDQALFQHYVSIHDMRRVQDHHHRLIEMAMPDMEALRHFVRSPDWVVLLTDPHGTIVHSLGAHENAPRELRMPLRAGRKLLEAELGTNAPGMVASEAVAAVVRGEEHFLTELRRLSCAAAPIFGLNGQVAGVLDITGFDVAWNDRVLDRVQLACRSIEARMFERAGAGFLVRLHEDPRFLGTPAQGLLWVREDGVVLAANPFAQSMLCMAGSVQALAPNIAQLLDFPGSGAGIASLAAAGQLVDGRDARPVYTSLGVKLFAHVSACQPAAGVGEIRRDAPRLPTGASAPLTDPLWQAAFTRASKVFPSGLPVLLQGETGTGKEWFARALHDRHRHAKPFVAINCAALADGVAEAELFGYVEGAFTGGRRGGAPGRIEQAQGGTLFLDEIGDMPPHLQTRLLRVLQERSLTRVGSSEEIALDMLVIAASHRELAALVEQGVFREDLYFRLNGLKVRLPALRERQDLDRLIDDCLHQSALPGMPAPRMADSLRRALHDYAWPGNIRQLRHALQVAALLAEDGEEIQTDLLPEEIRAALHGGAAPVATAATAQALSERKRLWARQALDAHGGNHSAAAKALGISRTTLYKHLSH